jgi:hypothetical protein
METERKLYVIKIKDIETKQVSQWGDLYQLILTPKKVSYG